MFGLIGKITAESGRRAELAAYLHDGSRDLPGCLSYVVALDSQDPDLIWVTEVWEDAEAHKASLHLPSVQKAITKGRPLIAGFETVATTDPLPGPR